MRDSALWYNAPSRWTWSVSEMIQSPELQPFFQDGVDPYKLGGFVAEAITHFNKGRSMAGLTELGEAFPNLLRSSIHPGGPFDPRPTVFRNPRLADLVVVHNQLPSGIVRMYDRRKHKGRAVIDCRTTAGRRQFIQYIHDWAKKHPGPPITPTDGHSEPDREAPADESRAVGFEEVARGGTLLQAHELGEAQASAELGRDTFELQARFKTRETAQLQQTPQLTGPNDLSGPSGLAVVDSSADNDDLSPATTNTTSTELVQPSTFVQRVVPPRTHDPADSATIPSPPSASGATRIAKRALHRPAKRTKTRRTGTYKKTQLAQVLEHHVADSVTAESASGEDGSDATEIARSSGAPQDHEDPV